MGPAFHTPASVGRSAELDRARQQTKAKAAAKSEYRRSEDSAERVTLKRDRK
jgi:hypothetical protein